MTNLDIAEQRIYNQHIARQTLNNPAELVKYMGAIQAQDYAGAKWAIGLRLQNSNDAAIDKAMADGSIIRTHVLRPTWHFVTPADARWMIDLTAPRINSSSASGYRRFQLDSAVLKRSNDILAKALEGGKQLSRPDVMGVLNQAGIATDELRFIHILMRAELDKVICSGGRQGKQFTYALFDDRVPKTGILSKDEALAELATRYFISHGPATLQDFTWWSGLAAVDAKRGLEIVKNEFIKMTSDDRDYWMLKEQPGVSPNKAPIAHLLPAFDEFAVAYKNRIATINAKYLEHARRARYLILDPSIIVNNQVAGAWKRVIKKNMVEIILNPFGKLNKIQAKAVESAAHRYKKFIGIENSI